MSAGRAPPQRGEAAADAAGGRAIRTYRWGGAGWVAADPTQPAPADMAAAPRVRLATMNILADCFPWFVRLAIASDARFAALCAEVERVGATVLGLNEVTPTSLTVLLASPFVRANYFVTELPGNPNGTIRPHGCVLLSKLPFEECYAVGTGIRAVAGVISVAGRRVAVCALHTTAYQTAKNRAFRAAQIARADGFLRALRAPGGHFIIGDLNLHYLAEDDVVEANGLLDLWAETHFGDGGDGAAGYTFDAQTNTMIPRYIPGEQRRMRLDRILCSAAGSLAPAAPAALWGVTPVDAERSVHLSDHYGVVVDLAGAPGGTLRGDAAAARRLRANAAAPPEPPAFSWPRFAAALTAHVPWLALRAAGWA